jgi:hypothetical protein
VLDDVGELEQRSGAIDRRGGGAGHGVSRSAVS